MSNFSDVFILRLKEIIPQEFWEGVNSTFFQNKPKVIRINTLKIQPEIMELALQNAGFVFSKMPWDNSLLLIQNFDSEKWEKFTFEKEGLVYRQGASSALVPHVLSPKPGEDILDLCAAPGSKSSQIVAMMQGKGSLVCVEAIRERMFRLKAVLSLLGIKEARLILSDARKFRWKEGLFDRILVDAPCSSEGRFQLSDPKTFAYWSLRKIKEMQQKQRGILLNASRMLKPGGTMVYSTCTFAPEENEAVVDWFLRKAEGDFVVEPVLVEGVKSYPAVMAWGNKAFDPRVAGCLRVLPTDLMEGFFVAKIVRKS